MSEKEYGISELVLTQTLYSNHWFHEMVYGPLGEAPLTGTEKIILARKIRKDLKAIHFDNGDEFFAEFWPCLRRSLATCNWFARGVGGQLLGPWVLWNVMVKKASLVARKSVVSRKPVAVGKAVQRVLDGMEFNSTR